MEILRKILAGKLVRDFRGRLIKLASKLNRVTPSDRIPLCAAKRRRWLQRLLLRALKEWNFGGAKLGGGQLIRQVLVLGLLGFQPIVRHIK